MSVTQRAVAAGLILLIGGIAVGQSLWRLPFETLYASRTTQDVLPLPDKPSIVVLPFVNMSGDSEQEYFSDSITEELTASLSRLSSQKRIREA